VKPTSRPRLIIPLATVLAGVVEGFRWVLLGVNSKPGPLILASAIVTVLLVVSGAVFFRRGERTFADVV